MEKVEITAAVAAALVREQFPKWAELPVVPVDVDGWDNTTFRLGDELSVRLPSADRYVAQVTKEHQWLPVLAPQLPLPIPQPVAKGRPGCGYPRPWSIYRWIDGEPARPEGVADLPAFAANLAGFLVALHSIDARDGPVAGAHSFYRGGPVNTYDAETRDAIDALAGVVDAAAAMRTWEAALAADWAGPARWVHGDMAASNLLVVRGELAAVIDFGCAAVGDPACDLVIAWTLFSGASRDNFVTALDLDDSMWARARGWALWKALITLRTHPADADHVARRFGWRVSAAELIEDLIAEG